MRSYPRCQHLVVQVSKLITFGIVLNFVDFFFFFFWIFGFLAKIQKSKKDYGGMKLALQWFSNVDASNLMAIIDLNSKFDFTGGKNISYPRDESNLERNSLTCWLLKFWRDIERERFERERDLRERE